ncbi:uncharacterized protein LOC121735349 isoform X2 [Aricia agestis]|uniref:uncharacterized protein LOC121735349 isoform X2 n=1 Tax=Aricia agestis TaxID=91739 RepID=UPI001C207FB4|nr:uncharacterized protein LOC121735349 isoform X2 [Aricia agestis]
MYTALLVLHCATLAHALNYANLLEDFPLVTTNSTPDAELMEELATFVSDAGVRRGAAGAAAAGGMRRYHTYILKDEHVYKDKVLYAAQEHMGELAPVLDKYRGDPGFRMKFIFNRLQQYTVDMRRIYTLAVRTGMLANVGDHMRLYQHLARKHVDVIYVVDHVIAAHDDYMGALLALQGAGQDRPANRFQATQPAPDMHAQEKDMDKMPPPVQGGAGPPGGDVPSMDQ